MMTNWLATPNSVASVVVRTEGLTYFPAGDADVRRSLRKALLLMWTSFVKNGFQRGR
jgi:hypothetical protein